MKRIALVSIILFIVNCPLSIVHCENIGDVFTNMPDSIYPLITSKNRHDMVDFYNNKMEAKVRNRLNDYARLDTLTNDYLHLTLSQASEVTMRMLTRNDSTQIICLVQTVTKPIRDSRVKFYDTKWQRLTTVKLPEPATADFFKASLLSPHDGGENPEQQALPLMGEVERALDDLRLVEVTVSPDEPVFTLTLSVEELAQDEKKVARRYVAPVRYRWTGSEFVLLP